MLLVTQREYHSVRSHAILFTGEERVHGKKKIGHSPGACGATGGECGDGKALGPSRHIPYENIFYYPLFEYQIPSIFYDKGI